MKSKYLLCLLLSLSALSTLSAQTLSITGRLKSTRGEYLEISQVPVRLISLEDARTVRTQLTDSLGRFELEVVASRSYELLISSLSVDTLRIRLGHIRESLQLGDILVRPRAASLGEVVVDAPLSSTLRIDKQIFYPTTHQLRGASNAVDVLANMMIQGIHIDPAQNRISTTRQGKLLVRINGAPASQKDYLRILPRQIKRIEYHDFPSLRYGDAEAVIDVVLRESIQGVGFVWDSRNAFHTPWGDIYGDIAYNWHRSELGVTLSGTMHRYNEQYKQGEEHYRLSIARTIDREIKGLPSPFKEDYATITLRYTYTDPDRRVFSAKVFYDYWREDTQNRALIVDRINGMQLPKPLHRDQDKQYKEFKPSFDLYYQRHWGQDIFAVNIVGSSFTSSSANKLLERYDQHIQSEIATTIEGSRYSIIGDVFWENKLKVGSWVTGVNFSMGANHNRLKGAGTSMQENRLNNYNTYAYAQWRGVYKKLGYGLGLGYTLYLQKQEHAAINKSHFITPQLNLSLALRRNLQARYSGSLRIQKFATGETNQVEYPVDTYVTHRGNPDLKPYNQLINQFALTFTPKSYRLSLNLFDSYARGGVMERYQAEGNKVVRQLINADKYHQLHINLGASSSFFEGKLIAGVGAGIRLMQTKSSTYHHHRTAISYDANISYNHNRWKYWVSYRSDQENLNGESHYRGNGLFNLGIDYRGTNYKVGIGYITSASRFESKKEYLANSYRSSLRSFNDTFRNTIYLSVSINLHSGKRFDSGDRYIYNADSDSGTLR